jgi:hypothetical protein
MKASFEEIDQLLETYALDGDVCEAFISVKFNDGRERSVKHTFPKKIPR